MIEKMSKSLILICLVFLVDVFNSNEMMCGHLVGAVPISMTSSIPKVDADSRVRKLDEEIEKLTHAIENQQKDVDNQQDKVDLLLKNISSLRSDMYTRRLWITKAKKSLEKLHSQKDAIRLSKEVSKMSPYIESAKQREKELLERKLKLEEETKAWTANRTKLEMEREKLMSQLRKVSPDSETLPDESNLPDPLPDAEVGNETSPPVEDTPSSTSNNNLRSVSNDVQEKTSMSTPASQEISATSSIIPDETVSSSSSSSSSATPESTTSISTTSESPETSPNIATTQEQQPKSNAIESNIASEVQQSQQETLRRSQNSNIPLNITTTSNNNTSNNGIGVFLL